MGTGRLVRVWVRVRVRVRYRYGTGTVRVRYMGTVGTVHGYGTWVRFSYHVPYPCTVPTVPVPCTQIAAEIRTMYPNSGRNSSRSATISAAIWVHGTGTVGTVPMYRTDRTHVSYPYSTVPVPYLYRTRTRTRTQTRTNRPVPIIWHTVLLPKWPIEHYSPN